jgi:uncharacterized damage-inducible protein DinB
MANLPAGSFPPYFANYINLVHADSMAEAIERYSVNIQNFFKNLPAEKIDYKYAEGKWTIKEMLQHIIDTERIFAYRALRISRGDKTPLPGFDENNYAAASNAASRSWQTLLEEFEAVRQSTDLLIRSFTPRHLEQSGVTNGHTNTTIAISFMAYGHILHHMNILKERYL